MEKTQEDTMENTLAALDAKAEALSKECAEAKEKARASITLTDKLELYAEYRRLRTLRDKAYRECLSYKWESETGEPWPI